MSRTVTKPKEGKARSSQSSPAVPARSPGKQTRKPRHRPQLVNAVVEAMASGQEDGLVSESGRETIKVLLALIVGEAWSEKSAMTVLGIARAADVSADEVPFYVRVLATARFVVLPVMGLCDHQRYQRYYIETDAERIHHNAGMMLLDAQNKAGQSKHYKTLAEAMSEGTVPWTMEEGLDCAPATA